MGHIPADVEHQGCQQDCTDAQEDKCESAPETDIVPIPILILLMGCFQLGNLCSVLALGIGKLLSGDIQIRVCLGGSEFCCGYLQIGSGKLLADF